MKSVNSPNRYRLLIALASSPLFGRLWIPLIDALIERELCRLAAARPHRNLCFNLTRAVRAVSAPTVPPVPTRRPLRLRLVDRRRNIAVDDATGQLYRLISVRE